MGVLGGVAVAATPQPKSGRRKVLVGKFISSFKSLYQGLVTVTHSYSVCPKSGH